MNAKQLIAHFERVSDAPNAASELRKLVLDLAVMGRLASLDQSDTPPKELLRSIRAEKSRLTLEKVIRKSKPLAPIDQSELPLHRPEHWEWARLGEVCVRVTKGSTPTSYGHSFVPQGVSFVKVESIRHGELKPTNISSFISEDTHNFLSRSQLTSGDILFSIAGSIGTCAIVPETILPANTNQALAIIGGSHFVFDGRFLLLTLRSLMAAPIVEKARGGAMNNISLADVAGLVVPIPPKEEQERIVAKVDELTALTDELENAQKDREKRRDRLATSSQLRMVETTFDPETFRFSAAFYLERLPRLATRPEHISELRRTILDLALRGRLAPQETAEEHAGQTGSNAMASGSEAMKGPYEIPQSWKWVRFGQIHELVRGVTYTKSDVADEAGPGYLPILRANNIGAELNFDDLVFVRAERVSDTQKLRRGDFLIALSSGSKNLVGKAAFVSEDYEMGFGGFCGAVRSNSAEVIPYVGVFLTSPLYRQAIAGGSRGIGINNIKRGTLNDLAFPLPPLPEQERIVAKVDELMAVCDELENQLLEGSTKRARMLEAVLHEALHSAA